MSNSNLFAVFDVVLCGCWDLQYVCEVCGVVAILAAEWHSNELRRIDTVAKFVSIPRCT